MRFLKSIKNSATHLTSFLKSLQPQNNEYKSSMSKSIKHAEILSAVTYIEEHLREVINQYYVFNKIDPRDYSVELVELKDEKCILLFIDKLSTHCLRFECSIEDLQVLSHFQECNQQILK